MIGLQHIPEVVPQYPYCEQLLHVNNTTSIVMLPMHMEQGTYHTFSGHVVPGILWYWPHSAVALQLLEQPSPQYRDP